MGLFYGNKNVATASTNLMFDKVYSSFWSMAVNMIHDNIYYGRNVLIEYGSQSSSELVVEDIYLSAFINANSAAVENTYLYTQTVYSDSKSYRLLYGTEIKHPSETFPMAGKDINKGQIIKVYRNGFEYWVCVGGEHDDETNKDYAKFTRLCTGNTSEYLKNRAIDCYHHAENKDNWNNYIVDYDSTVWQRVDFGVNSSGYVNIAHLNAKLPDFHTGTEAPSQVPMSPHFSHDSGGVYYQLRMQPQWGFRLAEAKGNSDFMTSWTQYTYDDAGNEKTTVRENVPAAINFNSKAFKIKNDDGTITRHDNTKNEITLKPTGFSGKEYLPHYDANNKENKHNVPAPAADTQELTINLPIIGNVISDAYDIIYGENRDSGNGSLAGYLEVFNNLPNDSIPVKSEDGALIGATLNSNHWIKATASSTDKKITINHDVPEAYKEGNDVIYGNGELNPAHGGTITIPAFSVDTNGHVKKNIANQTITLPAISLNNDGEGNLVTGLALTPDTGAFIAAKKNVGTLALTEYVNDTNTLIGATDTINGAFKKLVDGLAAETADREGAVNAADTALTDAKTELTTAYTTADNGIKELITAEETARKAADENLSSLLGNEIVNRGTAITNAISKEVTDRNDAITSAINIEVTNRNTAIKNAVDTESSARGIAITEAVTAEATARNTAISDAIGALDVPDTAVAGQYVSQVVETDGKITVTRETLPDYSAKYDVNTKFTYNDTEMTIGDLFAKVADLEARLAALENPTV